MKTIAFGRRAKTYLPEITAYIDYINNNVEGWSGYDSQEIEGYDPLDFDVVWRFMGFDVAGKGNLVVHEYNSLSTGLLASPKNHVKKILNVKPAARVFLNRVVRSQFSFGDGIPYAMFVYAGSLKDRGAIIPKALEHFKTNCPNASLLVVGKVPDYINQHFGGAENITFTGRVSYSDVPALAKKARFGLNLMPDIYPFNSQTATKVLEYCALGLPVVSSDYKWVRRFEAKRLGRFFFLNKDFSNLTLAEDAVHLPSELPSALVPDNLILRKIVQFSFPVTYELPIVHCFRKLMIFIVAKP